MSRYVVARLHNQIRVLDQATRHRRRQRQLDNLEKDNFQEDPHASFAHLIGKHKLPTFSDSNEGSLHVQLFSVGESEDASTCVPCCHVVCFCRQGSEETKEKQVHGRSLQTGEMPSTFIINLGPQVWCR